MSRVDTLTFELRPVTAPGSTRPPTVYASASRPRHGEITGPLVELLGDSDDESRLELRGGFELVDHCRGWQTWQGMRSGVPTCIAVKVTIPVLGPMQLAKSGTAQVVEVWSGADAHDRAALWMTDLRQS